MMNFDDHQVRLYLVVGIAAILIAAALGTEETSARTRKARLRELANRLGIFSRSEPGLRARLLYVAKQWPDVLLETIGFLASNVDPVDDRTRRRWGNIHYEIKERSGLPIADIESLLPPPTVRSEYESLVPWLARELHKEMRENIPPFLESPSSRRLEGLRRYSDMHQNWIGGDHLPSLLDWFEEEAPNISSMSWRQAHNASREWHLRFASTATFRSPIPDGIRVAEWPDGDHIDILVTKMRLENEENSMGHCVGGYWPRVRNRDTFIFSYRQADGMPLATLETGPDGYMIQLRAPRNDVVEDRKILDLFFVLFNDRWRLCTFPDPDIEAGIIDDDIWKDIQAWNRPKEARAQKYFDIRQEADSDYHTWQEMVEHTCNLDQAIEYGKRNIGTLRKFITDHSEDIFLNEALAIDDFEAHIAEMEEDDVANLAKIRREAFYNSDLPIYGPDAWKAMEAEVDSVPSAVHNLSVEKTHIRHNNRWLVYGPDNDDDIGWIEQNEDSYGNDMWIEAGHVGEHGSNHYRFALDALIDEGLVITKSQADAIAKKAEEERAKSGMRELVPRSVAFLPIADLLTWIQKQGVALDRDHAQTLRRLR